MTGKPLGSKIRRGKKFRLLESDRTIDLISKRLSAPIEYGAVADQRNLLVGEVRPDPEHHRRILVSMSVLKNPDLAPDEETRRQAEGVIGLSQSIKANGQVSPIDVYQEGTFFRILDGERRYWAARLAGYQTIYALVRNSKPENIHAIRLAYNVQWEPLEQCELLVLLSRLWREAVKRRRPINSPAELIEQTGLTRSVGYRWWRVLTERKDIADAILDERITSAKSIDRLLALPPSELDEAINALSTSEHAGESCGKRGQTGAHEESGGTQNDRPKKREQKGWSMAIHLIQTTNLEVAKVVYERLSGRSGREVDWTDPKAVDAAFKEVIAQIEETLSSVT